MHGRGRVVRATGEAEDPATPSSDGGVAAKTANLLVAERFASGFAAAPAYGVLRPALPAWSGSGWWGDIAVRRYCVQIMGIAVP